MKKSYVIIYFSAMIFMLLSYVWMQRAKTLPMDNDEFYSQVASVDRISWRNIFSGHVDEGNNAPLFYAMQKLLQSVSGYQTPQAWFKGQWGYEHPPSKNTLRVLPVIYMAAGVALLCFYVFMRFGLIAGFYALALCISSYMVWVYACIARPYSLWFFLSSLQIILLLFYLESKPKNNHKIMICLIATHWLLSLTVVLSVITNMAVCVVLAMAGMRKLKNHLLLFVIPTVNSAFYYLQAPKYLFFIKNGMGKLFGANLPIDRILIIVIGLILFFIAKQNVLRRWIIPIPTQMKGLYQGILIYGGLIFAGSVAVYMKLKLSQSALKEGFEVSNRYFMLLTPIGIVLTLFASYCLIAYTKGVLRKGVVIFLGLLLAYRFFRVVLLAF